MTVLEANQKLLRESAAATGRSLKEDGEVVNLADLTEQMVALLTSAGLLSASQSGTSSDGSKVVSAVVAKSNDITEIYDDGTHTYICYAVRGSGLTDSVWVVQRINNTSGSSRWSAVNQLATNVTIVAALTYT